MAPIQFLPGAKFDPSKYGKPVRTKPNPDASRSALAINPTSLLESNMIDSNSDRTQSQVQSVSQVAISSAQSTISQQPPAPENESPLTEKPRSSINIPDFDPSRYGRPTSTRQQEASLPTEHTKTLPTSSVHGPASNLHANQAQAKQTQSNSISAHASNSAYGAWTQEAMATYPTKSVLASQSVSAENVAPQSSSAQAAVRGKWAQKNDNQHGVIDSFGGANGRDRKKGNDARVAATQPSSLGKMQETPQELLKRIQASEMKQIGYRNRNKERGGPPVTTSLTDLELARRPLPPGNAPKSTPFVRPTLTEPSATEQMPASLTGAGNFPANEHPQVAHGREVRRDSSHPSNMPQRQKQLHYTTSKVSKDLTMLNWASSGTANYRVANPGFSAAVPNTQFENTMSIPNEQDFRWATKDEVKPIYRATRTDSNAWGSELASDASTESGDSVKPMHHGKLFRNKDQGEPEQNLAGWDGKLQPPPVDWNDRPRFNNNTIDFRNGFNNWAKATAELVLPTEHFSFRTIPAAKVLNLEWHPDGLDMVPRDFTIDNSTATYYGYQTDLGDALATCKPLTVEDFRVDWGKLDLSIADNVALKDETTGTLVQNWIAHQMAKTQPLNEQPIATKSPMFKEPGPEPQGSRSKLNVYLRPATKQDIQQMTDIYNYYIQHSARTAETVRIPDSEMRIRFDNAAANSLPFIVAIKKSKKGSKYYDPDNDPDATEAVERSKIHPIQNIDPTYRAKWREESVVGWACANDFTAADYVERISVELEVYVDPDSRQKGVGRCLLDKLLEACDRGHVRLGSYNFHCPPEIRHMYDAGGRRDLHKLIFCLRTWQYTRNPAPKHRKGKGKALEKMDDREDDYECWLRGWLESWDFEVQGILTGVGAKHGRL